MIICIFSHSRPFPTNFCLKRCHNCIYLIFWIFYEFSITRRVETKQNDNFYFPCFSVYSNLLWLEMKPQWYFYIFRIFLLFFRNFLLRVGLKRNGMIIFIFLVSRSIPTYYGVKWSHNGIFIFSEFFFYFLGIFYYASGRNETER